VFDFPLGLRDFHVRVFVCMVFCLSLLHGANFFLPFFYGKK
jgi:hypothetical protein